MSRIRSIKPEFFESRTLASCSRDARLVFAGLFTIADDEGRLKDLPKKLVGELFPHDEDVTPKDLTAWLDELEAVDSIRRYKVGADTYIYLPRWRDHQKISHASPSRLPDPPEVLRNVSRDMPETLAPDLGKGSRNKDLGKGSRNASANAGAVDVPSVPAPETGSVSRQPKKATPVPSDFPITESLKNWAVENHVKADLSKETEKFLDYYRSKGQAMKDWTAAWRNWMRRAGDFKGSASASSGDGETRNPYLRMLENETRKEPDYGRIIDLDAQDRNQTLPSDAPRALGQALGDS